MTMNFFGRKTKEKRRKKEACKAMFERKFCLAKSDPDPVFDLSECGLETVPSAVFKFVRVLRKTSLLLQNNELKILGNREDMKDLELLETLIVSWNNLTMLPFDINFLKSLRILDVSNNQLKNVPDSLCELAHLEAVNLSCNALSRLPDDIGRLTRLLQLNVENNLNLKVLPLSLHHAANLTEMSFSENQEFSFPPQSVICQGVSEILSFLAKECNSGCDKRTNEPFLETSNEANKLSSIVLQQQQLEAKLKMQELQKADKAKEKLAFEEQFAKHKQCELDSQIRAKQGRNNLLQEIRKEQLTLENKMKRLHLEKKAERSELLACLQEVEKLNDIVIKDLLEMNSNRLSDDTKLRQEKEDKIFQEKLLKTHFDKSELQRKEAVYEAMLYSLACDSKLKQIICDHQTAISEIQNQSLESEKSMNEKLKEMVANRDCDRKELLRSIEDDELLQRNAVTALLQQSDVQSFKLTHEIRNIEKQLAQTTQLEVEKKKLNALENLVDLCEKRIALSQLLERLLKERDERKAELLHTVELLQNQHLNQDEECGTDFWLCQYQKLLRLLPGNLSRAQQNLDPRLVHHLVAADVVHCIPFLAHCLNLSPSLREISDHQLKNAGIVLSSDRIKVLEAVKNFLCEIEMPVVPPLEDGESDTSPSAPPINECVVCLDNEISVVFVDCGHCCCCDICAVPLNLCPLCRTPLHKKLNIQD